MHGNDHRYGGPDPIPLQPVLWASGKGGASGVTLGNATTWVYVDTAEMVTNAPDIFSLATGGNGSLGLKILRTGGFFRIWASMEYTSNSSALTAVNFGAQSWLNFSGSEASMDNTFDRGRNGIVALGFGSTVAVFYTSYCVDVLCEGLSNWVADTPSDVVEFGLIQNTGDGGQYNINYMVEWLADENELGSLTFLP